MSEHLPALQQIEAIPWVKDKERDIDVAIESIYFSGSDREYFQLYGVDFEVKNMLALSDGRLFFDERELAAATKLMDLPNDELASLGNTITIAFERLSAQYQSFLQEPMMSALKALDDQGLAHMYERATRHQLSLIPYSFLVSMILERIVGKRLIALLAPLSDQPETLYASLATSSETTRTQQEARNRSALIQSLQDESQATYQAKLKAHVDTFGWLTCYRPTDPPLTIAELNEAVHASAARRNVAEPAPEQESPSWVAEVPNSLDESSRLLLELIRKNSWLRTARREVMSYGFFMLRPLIDQIAHTLEVPFESMRHITHWEVVAALRSPSTRPSNETIASRASGFAMTRIGTTPTIFTNDPAQQIYALFQPSSTSESVSGMVVFPGLATGSVQVLRSVDQLAGFRTGSILVAPTVATWMTPAVERCHGIITDAGGVLSHTAIVAREYSKPCIVGTHNATSAFHDGDFVTMNNPAGTARHATHNALEDQ